MILHPFIGGHGGQSFSLIDYKLLRNRLTDFTFLGGLVV